MTVRTIPKQYEFKCDRCSHKSTIEIGGLADNWTVLIVNGSPDMHFCPLCAEQFGKFLNGKATVALYDKAEVSVSGGNIHIKPFTPDKPF